jgi:hypothetical protein
MTMLNHQYETALKEYSPIIELLSSGKQIFLIRKQKITMDSFWLYPLYSYKKTNFKDLDTKIKNNENKISIYCMAKPVMVKEIDRETIIKLDNNFGWNLNHVLNYMGGRENIWIIIVRVYKLDKPININHENGVNFVKIRVSPDGKLRPVLSDKEFKKKLNKIEVIIEND